ncbi:hypothetical protein OIU91_41550 (plasmid) [Streptomyces sp. NBC_01456]|uniref:hypothetical protein n=1 Tax=unclassified Streptomyces TaxID=2593676 RepID=UPI002E34567F|nr:MULTISPECIES: hypothetical protein [unclassified Streptomyces]
MTGSRTPQLALPTAELPDSRPTWTPLRGDLAHDSSASRTGVVVALPEDIGANVYHLCPEGGGDPWPALRDNLTPSSDGAEDGLFLDEAARPPGGFAPDGGGTP